MHFSIIIPAKNEEANIGRCLDSIRQVEYDKSQYEVIVVDNGSSDRTVELAVEKGASVYVKPELTISGLRNFGASQANGDILAFLDADCAVSAEWLQAASQYLNDTDGVVAFGSPVVVPVGATWVQSAWFHVRGKPGEITTVEWLESANLFVQRKSYEAVKGFNESLITCEDYDLTQRLKCIGRLVSDYRVKATHYREPATISQFIRKEIWRSKSNYTGLLNRRVDLAEVPSLALPLVYGALLIALLTTSVMSYFAIIKYHFVIVTVLVWQLPIMLFAVKKGIKFGVTIICQLYVLLNAYFLARSLAVVCR